MFKVIKEDIENEEIVDEKMYRNALAQFLDLINDEAFKIKKFGEVTLPRNAEEKQWMVTRIQEVQEKLEDLKRIVM